MNLSIVVGKSSDVLCQAVHGHRDVDKVKLLAHFFAKLMNMFFTIAFEDPFSDLETNLFLNWLEFA